jgi:hypothetical protein
LRTQPKYRTANPDKVAIPEQRNGLYPLRATFASSHFPEFKAAFDMIDSASSLAMAVLAFGMV